MDSISASSNNLVNLQNMGNHLQPLNEYRPISLIGSIYKIIPKVMATRLNLVLGKVISHNQTAFLSKRKILDGVLR
ncbi:hypothetical protein CR513_39271, partial [Mucuna pruriens]